MELLVARSNAAAWYGRAQILTAIDVVDLARAPTTKRATSGSIAPAPRSSNCRRASSAWCSITCCAATARASRP